MKKKTVHVIAVLSAVALLVVGGVLMNLDHIEYRLLKLGKQLNRETISELHTTAGRLQATVDQDIWGGVYYTGQPWHPQLYVLLTDLDAAPENTNPRVHFLEAKFSETQLTAYYEAVASHYRERGMVELSLDIRQNRLSAIFLPKTDLHELYDLVPPKAIEFTFGEGGEIALLAETTPSNAETTWSDGSTPAAPLAASTRELTPEDQERMRRKEEQKAAHQVYNQQWGAVRNELAALAERIAEELGEDVYARYSSDFYPNEPQLYFYLTDLDRAPKVDNPRFHFIEVKYSYKQLCDYMDAVVDHYAGRGIFCASISYEANAVEVSFKTGTDLSDLESVIPLDAIVIQFHDQNPIAS